MEQTPNLNLNQIELDDYIRDFVNHQFNDNMEKLDNAIQTLKTNSHYHENMKALEIIKKSNNLNSTEANDIDAWNKCINDINDILAQLELLEQIKEKLDSFSDHIKNYNNPHKVKAEQITDLTEFINNLLNDILTDIHLKGSPTVDTPNNESASNKQIINIEYLENELKKLKEGDYWHKHDNKLTLDDITPELLKAWNNAVDKWNSSEDDTAKTLRDDINEIDETLDNHVKNTTTNPHKVTKDQVGLSNVDNLSLEEILHDVILTGIPTLSEDADPKLNEENNLRIASIGYVKKLLDNDGTDLQVLYGVCNTNPELKLKHIEVEGFTSFANNFILNIRFENGFTINDSDPIYIHIVGTENIEQNHIPFLFDNLMNISTLYEDLNDTITCCRTNGIIQVIYLKNIGPYGSFIIPMMQENLATIYLRKNSGGFTWRVYKRHEIGFIVDEEGDGTITGKDVIPVVDENSDIIFGGIARTKVDEEGDGTFSEF